MTATRTAPAPIATLAEEANWEIGKLQARLGAPCAHANYSACRCQEGIRADIAWWENRLRALEACG